MTKMDEIAKKAKQAYWERVKFLDKKHVVEALCQAGLDEACEGFWVYYVREDLEFYSPRFREALGFDIETFPDSPESWKKYMLPADKRLAIKLFGDMLKGKGDYRQVVHYERGRGDLVKLLCEASIVEYEDGVPSVVIGLHMYYKD